MSDRTTMSAVQLLSSAARIRVHGRYEDFVWSQLPCFGPEIRQRFAQEVVEALNPMLYDFDALSSRVPRLLVLLSGLHNNLGAEPARARMMTVARAALARWGEPPERIEALVKGFDKPPCGRIVFKEMSDER